MPDAGVCERSKAITAGAHAELPGSDSASHATDEQSRSQAGPVRAGEPEPEPWERACAIYQRAIAAPDAKTFTACVEQAKAEGLDEESVLIDKEQDEWQDLESALRDLWREKAKATA